MGMKAQGSIEWAKPTTLALNGQGSTEYLVLLAVVLMIALVAIALLGYFPGLALDAKKTQSDSYWKAERPIGVLEHSQVGTNLTLVLQNNEPAELTVTAVYSGDGGSNLSSFTINGGEKKVVAIYNATSCATGSAYEYAVNFTYNSKDLTNQKQLGTKPLIGKCA